MTGVTEESVRLDGEESGSDQVLLLDNRPHRGAARSTPRCLVESVGRRPPLHPIRLSPGPGDGEESGSGQVRAVPYRLLLPACV